MSRKGVLLASGVGVMLIVAVLSGFFFINHLGDSSDSQSTQGDSSSTQSQPENHQIPRDGENDSTESDIAGWVKEFGDTVEQTRPHFEMKTISKEEVVTIHTGSEGDIESNINQISLIYANSIDEDIIEQEASDGTYQPRKGDTAPYRPPDLIIRNNDGDTVTTINGRLVKYHAIGTLSEEEYLNSNI